MTEPPPSPDAPVTDKAVAVYGALRSGTTLLRLMLNAHPGLSCPGEMDFLFDHLRADGSYDAVALERDRIYRAHRDLYAHEPLDRPTPDALIRRVAGVDCTAILMLHRHISRAVSLYPELRIIHFLRDPRDVARSSIGMGWAGNVYHGIDHWIETEGDWARIAPTHPAEKVLTIHYETLIDAPEDTLKRICNFVGVPFDAAMLDYHKTSSYAAPSRDLTTQWKRKQTAKEVGLVEAKLGPLLAASGYAPSGFTARHPSAIEKIALKLDDKRARWASRIARFGLVDPLIVTIAHRLRLPALSAGAQRRIDEKTIRRLK